MRRTINLGANDFADIRINDDFYVDKTGLIRDWWFNRDRVTLICRPRRFGKTLNLDTVRCFLSTEYASRGEELFAGLNVWESGNDEERAIMKTLQGTVPVVNISFARVKKDTYPRMIKRIAEIMVQAKQSHGYLLNWEGLTQDDCEALGQVRLNMDADTCAGVPNLLCRLLERYWGVKPVVLIDEYDTPMEHAWTNGFWKKASSFMGDLMVSTFKENPSVERGLITGITRVGRESIFSDLNNLEVITTSSTKYRTYFGFTQDEVNESLAEYGLDGDLDNVRRWYDGYFFGAEGNIYNPWSIVNFLENEGVLDTYWANTSSNGLISYVFRRGDADLKRDLEELVRGKEIYKTIDDQVVYSELYTKHGAVWALLLAAGYLTSPGPAPMVPKLELRPLRLTNFEVALIFDEMVKGWFISAWSDLDGFAKALLIGDAETATLYLSQVTIQCMSYLDGRKQVIESGAKSRRKGKPKRGKENSPKPESFYHGLVLGLLVSLRDAYEVTSNRENGLGRCDITLVPLDGANGSDPAVILELKVFDPSKEKSLAETIARAKTQIEDKGYVEGLVAKGIGRERIRTYGIAFRGKEVLIG